MATARTFECTVAYRALVNRLKARMLAGDDEAAMIIGAMALLMSGWRCGDPDPREFPDDDPEENGDESVVALVPRVVRAA